VPDALAGSAGGVGCFQVGKHRHEIRLGRFSNGGYASQSELRRCRADGMSTMPTASRASSPAVECTSLRRVPTWARSRCRDRRSSAADHRATERSPWCRGNEYAFTVRRTVRGWGLLDSRVASVQVRALYLRS